MINESEKGINQSVFLFDLVLPQVHFSVGRVFNGRRIVF